MRSKSDLLVPSSGSDFQNYTTGFFASGFSFFLLYLALPPNDFPEAAYFFLFPSLVWFNLKPKTKIVVVSVLSSGFVFNISLLFWMRHVTVPGLVLASFFVSLYHLAWFVAASKLVMIGASGKLHQRLTVIIVLSSFWVVIEWSRSLFPFGFPWCPLSVSQWERPAILQLVPLFGAWIVSFFLIFFNLSIASYLHNLLVRRRREVRQTYFSNLCPEFYLCLAFFLIMLTPVLFNNQYSESATGKSESTKFRVGVCQPYLIDKWISSNAEKNKQILINQTRLLALQKPDLIVWPEASTPYAVNEDRQWVEHLSADIEIPLLIGAITRDSKSSYNSVVKVSPTSGMQEEFYSKQILVPFGEYIPFPFNLFSGFRKIVGPVGDFSPGAEHKKYSFSNSQDQSFNIFSFICYEDIFPNLMTSLPKEKNSSIFVTTNDAWFGEEGCAEQHAAHSVFRALETGMPVLRCGNAGWSGWISHRGVIKDVLRDQLNSIYFRGAGVFEISLPTERLQSVDLRYYFLSFCAIFCVFYFALLRKLMYEKEQ